MPLSCPTCASPDHEVKDSRPGQDCIVRRRRCQHCSTRFTTREAVTWEGHGGDNVYRQISQATAAMVTMSPEHRGLVVKLIDALSPAAPPVDVEQRLADLAEAPCET